MFKMFEVLQGKELPVVIENAVEKWNKRIPRKEFVAKAIDDSYVPRYCAKVLGCAWSHQPNKYGRAC